MRQYGTNTYILYIYDVYDVYDVYIYYIYGMVYIWFKKKLKNLKWNRL